LLEEKGIDAPETALLFGALATSLEFFGGNSKLVDTFVDALGSGSAGLAKRSAKELLTNIPQEAMQEGAQEALNVLNTVVNTGEDFWTQENVEGIIEGMAAGAVGGGAGAVVQAGANQRATVEDQLEKTDVNVDPTEGQKEAGNYKKGHVNIDGFDIAIENPSGSVRSGQDADGNEWSSEMNGHYGYFKRTEGKDGDQIDVVIKPNTSTSPRIFIVDQVENGTDVFDEHKVILGARDEADAREIYQSNYDADWQGLGNITEMGYNEFQKWVNDGKRKKDPVARSREERAKDFEEVFSNVVPPIKDAQESVKSIEESSESVEDVLLKKQVNDYADGINSIKAADNQQEIDEITFELADEGSNIAKLDEYVNYIKSQKFTVEEQALVEKYWQGVKAELNATQEKMTPGTEAFMRKQFFETKLAEIEGNVQQDAEAKVGPEQKITIPLAEQNKRQAWFQQVAQELGDNPTEYSQPTARENARTLPGEGQPGNIQFGSTAGIQPFDFQGRIIYPQQEPIYTKQGKPFKSRQFLEGYISEFEDAADYSIAEVEGGFVGVKKSGQPQSSAFKDEQQVGNVPQFQVRKRNDVSTLQGRKDAASLLQEKGASISTDNPGGDWLENEQRRAANRKAEGSTYMGALTANVRNINLDPVMLVRIPGMMGEHQRIFTEDERVNELAKAMKKEGYQGSPVFINVDYEGDAFINEGNHRVRAALQAGLDTIPVEISYY
jgi:hypothetical protein